MSREGDRHRKIQTQREAKRDQPDDQTIKEFAETAMNELLGLYGYGKVDSRDTLGLSLHRFTATHSPPRPASPTRPPTTRSPTRQDKPSPPPTVHSPAPHHGSEAEHEDDSLDSEDMAVPRQAEQNVRSVSPLKTDQGSGSSRGSTPKSDSGGGASGATGLVLCSWCGRVCGGGGQRGGSAFQLSTTSGELHFCSEVCFTQCRRASFKKSKVCDWCRHVRPTVTYVDFTDGDHQLQFCSDKCLNQYKMQIFCRETEAHLQMHPHLNDLKPATSSGLITPDLWLRDCSQKGNESDTQPENDVQVGSPDSPPRPVSPTLASPDPSEPVNLTTTQSSRNDPRGSSPPARASPLPARHSTARPTETRSPVPPPTPRYGRPRLRDRREGGRETGRPRTMRSSLQIARNAQPETDRPEEPVRMPTIRVRQLEAQQQEPGSAGEREVAAAVDVVGSEGSGEGSPHPPPQPPGLPLGGLGGGLGGLLPIVGGAPLLLPHMLPPDLPRTPLLPHLLLQRSELLRPPPIRHPLLTAPQPPAPPTPAPPTAVPPPPPGPPKTLGGSLLPPVTVLLPCPLPIPIPIPIPIPLPIPIPTRGEAPEARLPPQKEPSGRPRSVPRKDAARPGSVINGPVGASTSAATPGCPAPAPPPPPPPTSSTSPSGEGGERGPRPDRERRSILRYTSDVYEINGVFLPRDSAWDSPEPLHLRRALVGETTMQQELDSRNTSESPSPEPKEDSKEALACLTRRREEDSTVRKLLGDDDEDGADHKEETKHMETAEAECSSPTAPAVPPTRKRPPASEHVQPLPKKKHLLV